MNRPIRLRGRAVVRSAIKGRKKIIVRSKYKRRQLGAKMKQETVRRGSR